MDEETKRKLAEMYWESYDKSDCVINYRRGNNDIDWKYWDGYATAMDEVTELLAINVEEYIPDHMKAEMEQRRVKAREMYARYGITFKSSSDETKTE